MKVAEGTQAFMFETSLQLAVTKVLLSHHITLIFAVGRGDLSEIGPILLRVLATADEQIPPLTNSLSLPVLES